MPDLAVLIERHLVSPASRLPVRVENGKITAIGNPFAGRVQDGVAVMLEDVPVSYFDDKFAVMHSGHEERGGEWRFAYAQQIALLETRLRKGGVVVDVGCGPSLPYAKPADAFVIGMEYSLPSIAANNNVDLRVCASAAAMPFADRSIDTVVCLYSIHHMVGPDIAATEALVTQVFRELARVIKPGGEILIFEMAPLAGLGLLERVLWNPAKKALGSKLDQFFWPATKLGSLATAAGISADLSLTQFASPAWTTFPPFFSLQWLRIPRFLYPLMPVLYRWRF